MEWLLIPIGVLLVMIANRVQDCANELQRIRSLMVDSYEPRSLHQQEVAHSLRSIGKSCDRIQQFATDRNSRP